MWKNAASETPVDSFEKSWIAGARTVFVTAVVQRIFSLEIPL